MKLKAFIQDLSEAGDHSQLYSESQEGSGYVLNVEGVGGYALENVHGLKSALGKERKRADEFESKLKKFGDVDLDEAIKAMQEVEKYKQFDPKSEADKLAQEKFKSLEQQLKEKHLSDYSTLESKLDRVLSNYEKVTVEAETIQAIAKHDGNTKLLMPHIKNQIKTTVDDEGVVSYSVVDEYGNPRIGDSKGSAMTIDQLVQEMRGSDEFSPAFKAPKASGGGFNPNAGSHSGAVSGDASPLQKIMSGLNNL